MAIQRRAFLSLLAGLGAGLPALSRAGTAAGADDVLLSVTAAGGETTFDLAQLDALPQQSFATSTLWTEGVITFSGPPLRAVLQAAGIAADQPFRALALNDYAVSFTPSDVEDDVPIVATRMNGETFGPRRLGPLWVVYPFDRDARFRSETTYSRAIWQLKKIVAGGSPG